MRKTTPHVRFSNRVVKVNAEGVLFCSAMGGCDPKTLLVAQMAREFNNKDSHQETPAQGPILHERLPVPMVGLFGHKRLSSFTSTTLHERDAFHEYEVPVMRGIRLALWHK